MKLSSAEIAKLAGVSRSTVTRVVNNYPDLSEETRQKVLKIIEENNYLPNLFARKLAGKGAGVIGVIVFTGDNLKDGKARKVSESFYYTQLVAKLIDEAETKGYSVLVSNISEKNNKWEKNFRNGLMDGAIVISGGKRIKQIEKLIKYEEKIVLIDYEKYISNENISTVNPDNFQGGYEATKHLVKKGHKNILHFMGRVRRKMSIKRARGYYKCLEDNNLSYKKIISGDYDEKISYEIMNEYISENKIDFTGIFAGNDYIALGAMKALQDNNYRVPEDVSIIGYDNLQLCEYTTPKITSVNQLDKEIAKKALGKLTKLLKGEVGSEETTAPKIIERESIQKIGGKK